MTKKNRVLAVVLAAAFLFVMLSSVLFIALEADHDCIGESCSICCRLSACENTLKSVGQAVFVLILAALTLQPALLLFSCAKEHFCRASLITLKVKLSN